MSDTVNQGGEGTPIQGEAPQYTETERRAMEGGWMPLDKWTEAGKDASEHRTAREFNDRGELLKRIQDQNKHIQRMSDSFETLRQHNAKTYEHAYKKAVDELRAAHAAAVNDGDAVKAAQIADRLADEKVNVANAVRAQQQAAPQGDSPEVAAWKEDNKWYTEDEDLAAAAEAIAFKFIKSKNGQVASGDVLAHVSKKMKEKFLKETPQQGSPAQKITAPNPVGDSRGAARQGQASVAGLREGDLSEDENKAMKDFVKYGLGTKQDYLKQLKDVRG